MQNAISYYLPMGCLFKSIAYKSQHHTLEDYFIYLYKGYEQSGRRLILSQVPLRSSHRRRWNATDSCKHCNESKSS